MLYQHVGSKDNNGRTPLHYECENGYIEIVQYLIEKGADIEAKDIDQKTPLFIAYEKGHLSIVKCLISKGARYDVQNQNDQGQSLFIYAYEHNNQTFIEYILSKENISPSIDELCTKKPLHHACEKGHLPIVQYFIEKGANIETKDKLERTPHHIACLSGHHPIVQYLIAKCVNIKAKDKDQYTPTHYAQQKGHIQIVQYLVAKGANIEVKAKKTSHQRHSISIPPLSKYFSYTSNSYDLVEKTQNELFHVIEIK